MGFHHVGWAGLELLTSGDPPALASQSAEIIGVSHSTRPIVLFCFLRQSLTAIQTGVQWHYLGSLQPQFPRLKQSSFTSSPEVAGTTGTHQQAWLIIIIIICRNGVLLCFHDW